MQIDSLDLGRCSSCHEELGLTVITTEAEHTEQFCSIECLDTWKCHIVEKHPFFEPEILSNDK